MKKLPASIIALLIVISPFILVIIWSIGYPYPYYLHNHYLKQYTTNFDSIELPNVTRQESRTFSHYGNLENSNGGGYLVAKILYSEQSMSFLRNYFQKKRIPSAEKNQRNGTSMRPPTKLQIMRLAEFEQLPFQHQLMQIEEKIRKRLDLNKQLKSPDNLYLVYTMDTAYWPSQEFRDQ